MTQTAHIDLPDGRRLDYEILTSVKAKSLRLKMTARDGLTVIAPKGLNLRQIVKLVNGKQNWIAAHLKQFDEVRHLLGEKVAAPPEAFHLPAMAEFWRVEYRKTRSKTVGARTDRLGRLLVYGAVDDGARCRAALRRWLTRHAKDTLIPQLTSTAAQNRLKFKCVMIKNQRTRWGSCSNAGVISLNAKLLFLKPTLVRYVIFHELCHSLERNHTNRFWSYLRQYEPRMDFLHGQMRDAWKGIPAWAHPVREGLGGL